MEANMSANVVNPIEVDHSKSKCHANVHQAHVTFGESLGLHHGENKQDAKVAMP
jgi:hypothetical protein